MPGTLNSERAKVVQPTLVRLAVGSEPDTWIFLRGLTRASAHWGPFVGEFEAALSARVLALDLPGNGALWQQASPHAIADMVAHCREQLKCLGVVQPVGVLAMSLGGIVAAHWAIQWPTELRELVLINTSMRPFSPAWQRLRPASLARILRRVLSGADAKEWESEILSLTTRHPHHDVLQSWSEERLSHPVSTANAWRQLLAAARFLAPLQAPAVPTLVLAGEGDRLVSAQCSLAIARQWEVDLRVHPTAGHDLTLDDGPWVTWEVQRWRAGARALRS